VGLIIRPKEVCREGVCECVCVCGGGGGGWGGDREATTVPYRGCQALEGIK